MRGERVCRGRAAPVGAAARRSGPAWLHSPIARNAHHRVTSVDVARHAGVSQSTVSLVFSGKGQGRVSQATQEAVRRSARELGYRPNVAAQALRLGTSRAVALLVPDITNPFFSRVLRGAQRAGQRAGYTVVLVDTANDRRWEAQSFEALRAGPVDGYLLFEVTPPEGLARDDAGPLLDEGPTAIFCDDDVLAAGLYLAARERGVRIPGDLSVIGFDDMDFARVLEPPLTTVALDAELLGSTAFELLEARLAGRRTKRNVVLPAQLTLRGSTAPPARAATARSRRAAAGR